MNEKQKNYEAMVQSLVGETIQQVVYYTYEIGEEPPTYDQFDGKFHELDQGVLFHTQSGKIFCFAWGSEFTQYGLDFMTTKLFDPIDEQQRKELVWDVTSHNRWQDYIGSEITHAEVYWSWSAWVPAGSSEEAWRSAVKTCYPQDVVLSFTNGKKLYLSASVYQKESDQFWGNTDNVIVIFDDEVAGRYLPMLINEPDDTCV